MRTPTRRLWLGAIAAASAAAGALSVGCSSGAGGSAKHARAEEGRAVFAPGDGSQSRGGRRADASAGDDWTILLATYSGDDALKRAQSMVPAVQQAGLAGAYAEARKRGAVIAYGAYRDQDDPRLRADLDRVHATQIDGRTLFANAFLAPRTAARPGSIPALDLSRVKESLGKDALYTLQVAVYESADREEARRKAEEAAVELRREGEMAFYYHAPSMSIVTIGVWGRDDVDLSTGTMSPEIQAAQKRYPDNLYNGTGIRMRSGNQSWLQPSTLVEIP